MQDGHCACRYSAVKGCKFLGNPLRTPEHKGCGSLAPRVTGGHRAGLAAASARAQSIKQYGLQTRRTQRTRHEAGHSAKRTHIQTSRPACTPRHCTCQCTLLRGGHVPAQLSCGLTLWCRLAQAANPILIRKWVDEPCTLSQQSLRGPRAGAAAARARARLLARDVHGSAAALLLRQLRVLVRDRRSQQMQRIRAEKACDDFILLYGHYTGFYLQRTLHVQSEASCTASRSLSKVST